jgi:hypothetical protein
MDTIITITKKKGRIQIETTNLPIATREENGKWIIFSPVFKVLGYSSVSEEEAFEDFKDSLNIFFHIHTEDGTLGRALQKFGWSSGFGEEVQPTYQVDTPISIPRRESIAFPMAYA